MLEGAESLCKYYELVSNAVMRLYENIRNGMSLGPVPTAYPQISKCLDMLSKNIPSQFNLVVLKGYAIALDVISAAVIVCLAFIGIAIVPVLCFITSPELVISGANLHWRWLAVLHGCLQVPVLFHPKS